MFTGQSIDQHPTAVKLRIAPAKRQSPFKTRPFQEWVHPGGTIWAEFYRNDAGYLIRFPGLADFSLSAPGRKIDAYPLPDVPDRTIEHIYLNQVLPLALSRQFQLVLHGSAIESGDAAVAFLGVSGDGKSTLTASFAVNGYRFLADDGLQLDRDGDLYVVRPGHPSIRLWDDSRATFMPKPTGGASPLDFATKSRLLADERIVFCDVPRPLTNVYFISDTSADTVAISTISRREAMIELVRHSFLLDVEEREMLTRHFKMVSALVKCVSFSRLEYPRRYDILDSVHDAVIEHSRLHTPSVLQP